jgi:hypothetical protein
MTAPLRRQLGGVDRRRRGRGRGENLTGAREATLGKRARRGLTGVRKAARPSTRCRWRRTDGTARRLPGRRQRRRWWKGASAAAGGAVKAVAQRLTRAEATKAPAASGLKTSGDFRPAGRNGSEAAEVSAGLSGRRRDRLRTRAVGAAVRRCMAATQKWCANRQARHGERD